MRKLMVGMLLCVLTPAVLYAANKAITVNWSDVGKDVEIKGHLGMPIGRFVIIEGERTSQKSANGHPYYLSVSKVNGEPLENSAVIQIDNLEKLPASKSYIFKGYETGKMVGVPPDVPTKKGSIHSGDVWHFDVSFVVVETVKPALNKG